ncbi:unnamed protein product, partial [Meganyctiphanes norvegica]
MYELLALSWALATTAHVSLPWRGYTHNHDDVLVQQLLSSLLTFIDDLGPTCIKPKTFSDFARLLFYGLKPHLFTFSNLLLSVQNIRPWNSSFIIMLSLRVWSSVLMFSFPLFIYLISFIYFLHLLIWFAILNIKALSFPCQDGEVKMRSQSSPRIHFAIAFFYYFSSSHQNVFNHILFFSQVMGAKQFVTLGQWQDCEWPLCPVVTQHEGRIETAVKPCLLATFSSADVARPALSRHNSQQVCTMLSYPELLVSAVFAERLEDNEVMQVTGALHTATVQDLKTKPSFIPRYQDTSPGNVIHALMDADDYKQSDVLQYEQINVLRELNKSFLAFTQPIPIGLVSPAISDIISVSRQNSHGSNSPATQYRTQVSSNEHSEDQLSKEENHKHTTEKQLLEEKYNDINEMAQSLEIMSLENRKLNVLSEKINKNNNIVSVKKEVVSDYLDDKNVYNSDMSSCSCNNTYSSQQINEVELKEINNLNKTNSNKINNNGNDIFKINNESLNVSNKDEQKRKEHASKICDKNKTLEIILENIQVPQPPREDSNTNCILDVKNRKENINYNDKSVVSAVDEEKEDDNSGDNGNSTKPITSIGNTGNSIPESNKNAEIIADDGNKTSSEFDGVKDVHTNDSGSGFVTAPTTLKRSRKRNRKKGKANKQISASDTTSKGLPLLIVDQSQVIDQENKKTNNNSSETLPKEKMHIEEKIDGLSTNNEETTRLLNKVLRAIQKLEEERPELLEEAVQEEQNKQQQPEIITRGKPPLPETKNKMSGQFSKSSETRVEVVPSVEQFLKQSQHRQGISSDGRKLSIYQTCPEEVIQSSVEDPYYSACESLENQDALRAEQRRCDTIHYTSSPHTSSIHGMVDQTTQHAQGDVSISDWMSKSVRDMDRKLARYIIEDLRPLDTETIFQTRRICAEHSQNDSITYKPKSSECNTRDLSLR